MEGRFKLLIKQDNPTGVGEPGGNVYGEMGPHARLLGPEPPAPDRARAQPPRFEPAPCDVKLADGVRWATAEDVRKLAPALAPLRERFGAAAAGFDLDGDGKQDAYLAAAIVGPGGLRDALLRNRGEGRFDEVGAEFGLDKHPASLGVAAGDFDADGFLDLYLTGLDGCTLLRNRGGKSFEDVTEATGTGLPGVAVISARWLDLDQDGDLDLYATAFGRLEGEAVEPGGVANAAFRNDGQPSSSNRLTPIKNRVPIATGTSEMPGEAGLSLAFQPWPGADELLGGEGAHTGVAALDVDADRDLDLVLTADDKPPSVVLNDRLGRFRRAIEATIPLPPRTSGLLATDLDGDGLSDLVAADANGPLVALLNGSRRSESGEAVIRFAPRENAARGWNAAVTADLDLDGSLDLAGVSPGGVEWLRSGRGTPLPLVEKAPSAGFLLADLIGDPLPDLLRFGEGQGPTLARNPGNGANWLAVELSGRWKNSFDHMRTNPQGLGTKLALVGKGFSSPFELTTPASGPAQSAGPFVLGLGPAKSIPLLELTWPDGVMQAELNVPAGQVLALAENNRKTGSCPVLFTWDGSRFACIGDFLGGGGLGYLVEPGVYSEPDRDEAVLINPGQLKASGGVYHLRIAEPMDEIAYLDRLVLDVIDTPPGLEAAPDERFAPGGNRPSGKLLAWDREISPAAATDLKGWDVLDRLARFDRLAVDDFPRKNGWIGYADEHGIVLDFGDRLSRFGPDDRLVLALAGWVEYPYSQTNYAASTAGYSLKPPVLERLRDDGTWELLEADPGYPAGLPRLTTLELTGKLGGPRCVLRLRTNMELYWDRAFIAALEPSGKARVTTLSPGRADLSYRGYLREVSPDGRLPLLYDYESIDPAPLARFRGNLTRHGDVLGLIREDDDHLCLVGPGDELALEFAEADAPALPRGLDPPVRAAGLGLLQGCRPIHRRQRRCRADAVEWHAPTRSAPKASDQGTMPTRGTCGPTKPARPARARATRGPGTFRPRRVPGPGFCPIRLNQLRSRPAVTSAPIGFRPAKPASMSCQYRTSASPNRQQR
ncbi:MAG: CRTAC1 family protein [Isosphaeraceae bacterium]